MTVTVTLHGNLRRLAPDHTGPLTVDLPDGAGIPALLDQLGAAAETWLVAVNGVAVARMSLLAPGDRVDCYEALAGG